MPVFIRLANARLLTQAGKTCRFLGRFLHVHVHVDTHDGSRRVGHSNKIRETLDKTLDGVRFEQSSCVVGVC